MKLRNKIPELLKVKGMKPAQLARKLDMSNYTAYQYAGDKAAKYFDGDSRETIGTLTKIAEALDVPFSALLEEVG